MQLACFRSLHSVRAKSGRSSLEGFKPRFGFPSGRVGIFALGKWGKNCQSFDPLDPAWPFYLQFQHLRDIHLAVICCIHGATNENSFWTFLLGRGCK